MKDAPERPRTPPNAREGGRGARRDMGLDLLIQGRGVTDVARAMGVDDRTVARWRDSSEGQRRMAEAKNERATEIEAARDTAADARKRLREVALKAVEALDEALDDDDVQARLRAAREVLDRAGVPRTSHIETSDRDDEDLSRFTDEELEAYERLKAKSRKT